MIVKKFLKDRVDTSMSISRALCEQTGKPIPRKTVSRRLNKKKLEARIPCHKLLISKKNQKVRLDFATEHIVWTEEQLNMVHFSDESKFNLFGSDRKRFVRRKMGNAYLPNSLRKCEIWRGSVMVWGMISTVGVGPVVCLHGNFNASIYKEPFRRHAFPHLHKGKVETSIFMQDNAPCHKVKTVFSFLEEEGISVMKWPPQSPDMYPLENILKIIGEKGQNRNPHGVF